MFGSATATVVEEGAALQCGHCGHELARSPEAIEVSGRHRHQVENSAGRHFQIACFATVPGVVAAGESTDEDTWFAGYVWQRAYCGGCKRHIGWRFRSPRHLFDALIRDVDDYD